MFITLLPGACGRVMVAAGSAGRGEACFYVEDLSSSPILCSLAIASGSGRWALMV